MPHTIQIPIKDDLVLCGVYLKPLEDSLIEIEKTLIIMVHGFPGDKTSHNNLFKDIGTFLKNKGYHSLSFDHRGCGESDGLEEEFSLESAKEDLVEVICWAKNKEYEKIILIGAGLGAATSLLQNHDNIIGLVLLWPMLDLVSIVNTAYKFNSIPQMAQQDGYYMMGNHRIGLSLIQELKATDLNHQLETLNRPLLIMHGTKDETSPIEQLDLVRQNVKCRRVDITSFQDGEHGLLDKTHREMMLYHIQNFIHKYCPA